MLQTHALRVYFVDLDLSQLHLHVPVDIILEFLAKVIMTQAESYLLKYERKCVYS